MEYCNSDFFRSSYDFHKDRPAADHINEPMHYMRIKIVASMIEFLIKFYGATSFVDLGCGNGGVLSLITDYEDVDMAGVDFAPGNVEQAQALDRPVIAGDFSELNWGGWDIAGMSEVLEHMSDPHGFLARLETKYIVASCPADESEKYMREEHVWAWDKEGFIAMFRHAGFNLVTYTVHTGPGMQTQFFCGEKR